MKTILAATDYSKTSLNAVDYAINLAKFKQSKVVLFHAYHPPIIASDVPITYVDFEKNENSKLNLLNKKLLKKHQNVVDIKNIIANGFALDTITEATKSQKSDLVVMGIKKSGKVGEMIFGSVASDAAGNINCPLLIIPDGASFKIPKKIVFAYDNNPVSNASLNFLKDLTSSFKSELNILNIIDIKSKLKNGVISKIEKQFDGLKHKIYIIENEVGDIVDEINKFSDKKSIDLVVMVARKHSFLNKLFHERKTKKMAFHTQIPLLVLSDVK